MYLPFNARHDDLLQRYGNRSAIPRRTHRSAPITARGAGTCFSLHTVTTMPLLCISIQDPG